MTPEQLELRERLLFGSAPAELGAACEAIRSRLDDEWQAASPQRRDELVELLAELSVDLGSYLPRWHLLAGGSAGSAPVDPRAEASRNGELLRRWGAEVRAREADAEIASIEASNLRRLSILADEGRLSSRWGHDSATGLTWAIRRGAVLVTTNPVMVNAVRKEDPTTWDAVRDALKATHPESTPEQRALLMTVDVVLEGCRELRPIWQATGGRYGYVSLQVSPRANDDAGRMTEEVQESYRRLERELGGTPNARFKIPGTRAGLEAVRRLTAQGIGVTVTVNASVDQQLAFGEAIEEGVAPLSFLVLMMGRLDDPVRDELAAAGLPDAVETSRWASVAVLRRSYQLLFAERGYRRSAIMAASMRGPWTIDGAIVDGPSEVFITCFPDKAREYDEVPRELVSRVHDRMPPELLDKLGRSETFRQAYEPQALSVHAFDAFVPVRQTLTQFSREYDEFVAYNR